MSPSIPDPTRATVADGAASRPSSTKRRAKKAPAKRPPSFPHTDAGNGQLIAERNHEQVRYNTDTDVWFVYDWTVGRWREDPHLNAMREIARDTFREQGRQVYAADATGTEDERRRAARHWIDSEKLDRTHAAIKWAQSSRSIQATSDQFDNQQRTAHLLCTPTVDGDSKRGGTVDLRTGKARPNSPDDMITRQTAVPYDPAAKAPRWLAFNAEIQPAKDMQAFMHTLGGYCVTGSTREQAVFMFYGPTAGNGKSTWLDHVRLALGDYGQKAPQDLLLSSGRNSDSNAPHAELTRLEGPRLAVCSETNKGRALDAGKMKEFSGKEQVSARGIREKKFREFYPQAKFITGTNHLPRIDGNDDGNRRRLKVVPFDQKFDLEAGTADGDLDKKLLLELPGILTWLVQGAVKFYANGPHGALTYPDAVKQLTRQYFNDNDTAGGFLEDICWLDSEDRRTFDTCTAMVPNGQLYAAYKKWCDENGYRPLPIKQFIIMLSERGFERGRQAGNKLWWYGIRLRTDDDDPESEDRTVVQLGRPCRSCGEPTAAHHNGLCPDCRDAQQQGARS